MKRILLAVSLSIISIGCTEITNITTPPIEKSAEAILSAPADPVMYVQPGQYFQSSVTVIAPIGQDPNLSFHIDNEVRITAGYLTNYGAVGCTFECKTNTWKYTLYFQAGENEGESVGTYKLEGTTQTSKLVIRRSWKG